MQIRGMLPLKLLFKMLRIYYEYFFDIIQMPKIQDYCFAQNMINRIGKAGWIELAAYIMLNLFCLIEGAYPVTLFHARELLLIEKMSIT